jgi:hypothetical protein
VLNTCWSLGVALDGVAGGTWRVPCSMLAPEVLVGGETGIRGWHRTELC